jgi:hypothetical protein
MRVAASVDWVQPLTNGPEWRSMEGALCGSTSKRSSPACSSPDSKLEIV